MMKNVAVVVTYNRLQLLKKAVDGLRNQTVALDAILVVNNGSTDGTAQWLAQQEGLTVVNQDNIGGSGGFWRGIREAHAMGADHVWCMDDDVHPYPDCLEHMLKAMPREGGVVAPQRLLDGKSVVTGGEVLRFNLHNPLRPMKHDATLDDINRCGETMDVEAVAFEGPLFSRNVIDRIGLPEKGLFIFWDDTDYTYRAKRSGFRIVYAKNARLFKEDLVSTAKPDARRSWKYPYMLRNETYFITAYAPAPAKWLLQAKIFMRFFMGLTRHLLLCDGTYQRSDYKLAWRAFSDGVHKKLGKY